MVRKNKAQDYEQKYAGEMIHIDAFSADKMGLIQAETILKLDKIQLLCSPFQVSMQRAVLLSVLSEREIPLLRNYATKLSSLKLSFSKGPGGSNTPIKLMLWTKINQLLPLKGRQSLCMIDLTYKNCPNDMIEILGEYIESYNELKLLFEKIKNKDLAMNNTVAKELGFNNFIEALLGKSKVRIRLLAIAVNRMLLAIPAIDPNLKAGAELSVKIYFITHRLTLKGKILKTSAVKDGFIKLYIGINFSPELTDIFRDYYHRQQFKSL